MARHAPAVTPDQDKIGNQLLVSYHLLNPSWGQAFPPLSIIHPYQFPPHHSSREGIRRSLSKVLFQPTTRAHHQPHQLTRGRWPPKIVLREPPQGFIGYTVLNAVRLLFYRYYTPWECTLASRVSEPEWPVGARSTLHCGGEGVGRVTGALLHSKGMISALEISPVTGSAI